VGFLGEGRQTTMGLSKRTQTTTHKGL